MDIGRDTQREQRGRKHTIGRAKTIYETPGKKNLNPEPGVGINSDPDDSNMPTTSSPTTEKLPGSGPGHLNFG
jgi:hypothetical protein